MSLWMAMTVIPFKITYCCIDRPSLSTQNCPTSLASVYALGLVCKKQKIRAAAHKGLPSSHIRLESTINTCTTYPAGCC